MKPDNILFNANGPLVITDWGIGYFVHKHSVVLVQLTRGGMGTEYYCSLEQWNTGKCDARGDIYSLGMTIDEWANASQRAILVGMGIGAASSVAETSVGAQRFNALLRAMTHPLPQHRPATMAVVAAEFRAIAAS